MLKTITCRLCGSSESRIVSEPRDYISGEVFRLVKCAECGLAFVNPQPSPEDLPRYYPSAHQRSEPAAYERMDAKPRVKFVTTLRDGKPGRILDIGCGKGLLLAELKRRGWDVTGIELSENSARVAANLGVNVHHRPVEDCALAPASFDVITMYHSLEHMVDPRATLQVAHDLLKPDGRLVVEVPNYGSWYGQRFGAAWFHLDVPRHLYHFSRETLEHMLAAADFRPERVQTRNPQYDAFGALQSVLNIVLREQNLLNNFNTGEVTLADIRSDPRSVRRGIALLASEAFLAVGFPVFLAVGAVSAPFADGGTLRIVARPAKSRPNAARSSKGFTVS